MDDHFNNHLDNNVNAFNSASSWITHALELMISSLCFVIFCVLAIGQTIWNDTTILLP